MNKIKNTTSAALVVGLSFLLLACDAGRNKTNVELIQDMMDQRNLKSQDYDETLKAPGNRMPPAGTVPRGFQPYTYETDPLGAEAKLENPLAGQMTEEVLARGRKRFDVYCAVCHGPQGAGDGTVAQYMALKPPPLISDKVKNFKDGRIFHIITAGQGVMGNYATQIHNVEDRWAIVNYIRSLQKAN